MVLAGTVSCLLLPPGCGDGKRAEAGNDGAAPREQGVLRLAVTTSTADSGLMDALVPVFERRRGVRVDVIAAGTGKALALGENGDVDVVLVHARAAEDRFMEARHGVRREDVMYNHFQIVGPPADPAKILGAPPVDALTRIADGGHRFLSRGDGSGTHRRERSLCEAAGRPDPWDGYIASGQGMGVTLNMADQMGAYTLTDRGTYLAYRSKITLVPLTVPGPEMRNAYGVIAVNPVKNERINHAAAVRFIDFVISPQAQTIIGDHSVDGESLFHPMHLAKRESAITGGAGGLRWIEPWT